MISFQCPSCGKDGFKTHATVARHMSQPRSGCNTWLDDLIRLKSHMPVSESPADNYDDPMDFESEDIGPPRDCGESEDNDGCEEGPQETVDYFPDAAETYGTGYTFLTLFNSDENSIYRKTNIYYPFSCRKDWEVASWLLRSGLSMGKIDRFLSLDMIKDLPLSFRSAKELRSRAEMLPSGPRWKSQIIPTSPSHPTKSPVVLYWRDPLECIASILSHPLFHDQLDFTPRKVYSTAQRLCRTYTEWISGDDAWNMQSMLPKGATLLGTILSSDKTNISVLTGDRVAHPLLIGLANLRMNTRMKSSTNSFLLTALLPVPKFIHKNKRMRGVLADRLTHQCLDIVLEPLKQAARHGVMLSDPVGDNRYCFIGLASYIADLPEAMMLSVVGGKTSPITMAMYKQFGDSFRHEPRTKSTTLAQLAVVRARVDPTDVQAFFREAQKFRLNGVEQPFWRDWPLAEPSHFLTPEPLHHLHREFWDHDAKWLIYAVGEWEMDFRFSVLQPITGFRHFREGISKLKQVTGRCHRDIQRSIIAVSADAAPRDVIIAVRALMDFRYLVQSPQINDDDLIRISAALDEFHAYKDAIIAAGVRRGKGSKAINNWHIPKLELMQSVIPSIRNSGVTSQWSADVTEHAHITEIKDPARSSNNRNYDPQICRYLDRLDKCRRFELATGLIDEKQNIALAGVDSNSDDSDLEDADNDANDDDIEPADSEFLSSVTHGHSRLITNYFAIAQLLQHKPVGSVPLPLRSFVVERTAFHLAYDPSIRNITVDDVAVRFGLSDLRPALADFLHREASYGHDHIHAIGGPRRAGPDTALPFEDVQVWFKLRLQNMESHDGALEDVLPPQTLNCAPPSEPWTCGHYDTAIVSTEAGFSWPSSGILGCTIAQIRLIIRPLVKTGTQRAWRDRFITYVHRFDIIPQGISSNGRDPATQMHLLKRAKRSNGTWMGDIIPVSQLRAPVNVVPRFGPAADNRLTAYNSMEHASEFWLNRFWDKSTYFALSL